MPRPQHQNIPDIFQHITQHGNNRQACFYADDDYRLYPDFTGAACRTHDCSLHACSLMTNHVHLLMTPSTPAGVSRVLQDLSRDFVRSINGIYRCAGTLWQDLDQSDIQCIHDSLNTVLPTVNDRFRREIEKGLSVRPGQEKRCRPMKNKT